MQFAYVNNTNADISVFHTAILEAIRTGVMPEELADILVITRHSDHDTVVINWAD